MVVERAYDIDDLSSSFIIYIYMYVRTSKNPIAEKQKHYSMLIMIFLSPALFNHHMMRFPYFVCAARFI